MRELGSWRARGGERALRLEPLPPKKSTINPTWLRLATRSNAHEPEGQPIPATARREFDNRFGVDFSAVRLHRGGELGQAAARSGTDAFTHGLDIAVAPGAPQLESRSGRKLLAHELAHVVQQSRPGFGGLDAERDAEQAADTFARGGSVEVAARTPVQTAAKGGKPIDLEASSSHGGTPVNPGEQVTVGQLTQIMPELGRASADVQSQYTDLLNRTFATFEIDTIESRAFFLAHATVESDHFRFMVEADRRQAYRARERNSDDPAWSTSNVTPAQKSDFDSRGYDQDRAISPPGQSYAYIGRGPLMVTKSYGYRQALAVLERWGQQLGARGQVEEATHVLFAASEIRRDPSLAAMPEYAFLLSAAHFKGTGTTKSGATVGMDYLASKNAPTTRSGFFGASGRMHGLAGMRALAGLQTKNPKAYAIHVQNLNEKFAVYQRALRVLCGSRTGGACASVQTP